MGRSWHLLEIDLFLSLLLRCRMPYPSLIIISFFILVFVVFFIQDLPLGLMDDIYDFVSKFAQRLDEVEEV